MRAGDAVRVAIATPKQAGPEWEPFLTDYVHPFAIREAVQRCVDRDAHIVTMNHTVLDMVRSSEHHDNVLIGYEDVVVWSARLQKLVPLTDIHDEAWLAAFSVGDLFEQGELYDAATQETP